MTSGEAIASSEALSGIEFDCFTPAQDLRHNHLYRPTPALLPSLHRRHSSSYLAPSPNLPSPDVSRGTMDTNQLAHELNSLRRNFAQYRVEMALRIDSLERRLSAAESALPGPGSSSTPLSTPALRRAPPAAPAPVHAFGSPMPGFAEHRRHPRAPVPINTVPASSGTQVMSSTPYAYPRQPPRSATPAKRAGSSENATFLPFVLERIASASQRKSPGDNRTW